MIFSRSKAKSITLTYIEEKKKKKCVGNEKQFMTANRIELNRTRHNANIAAINVLIKYVLVVNRPPYHDHVQWKIPLHNRTLTLCTKKQKMLFEFH